MAAPKISSQVIAERKISYRKWLESEDEDTLVRQLFAETCAKAGVESQMDKYYHSKQS